MAVPVAPSVTSVMSVANDRAVHRSPRICLTAEENPKKTSSRRPADERAVQPVIASNGVGRIAQHVRKEGRDGIVWTEGLTLCPM